MGKVLQFRGGKPAEEVEVPLWYRVLEVQPWNDTTVFLEPREGLDPEHLAFRRRCLFEERNWYLLPVARLEDTDDQEGEAMWRRLGSGMTYGMWDGPEEVARVKKVQRSTLDITAKVVETHWQKQLDKRHLDETIVIYETWDPQTVVIRPRLETNRLLERTIFQYVDVIGMNPHPETPPHAGSNHYGGIVLNVTNMNFVRMTNLAGNPNDQRDRYVLDRWFSQEGYGTLLERLSIGREIHQDRIKDGPSKQSLKDDQYLWKKFKQHRVPYTMECMYLKALQEQFADRSWEFGFDMETLFTPEYVQEVK
jgi:hypothetical protein